MLKKLIILLVAIAPICAFAQDKIAYINTQEVYYQMPEIKGVEAKINAKQEEIKKMISELRTEYETLAQKFQSDTTTLTPSIIADRQKQLDTLEERYQVYTENSQKELQELSQKEQAPLMDKLQKAIQSVGAKNGFTYIIEKNAAPYIGANAVDAGTLVKTELGIK